MCDPLTLTPKAAIVEYTGSRPSADVELATSWHFARDLQSWPAL